MRRLKGEYKLYKLNYCEGGNPIPKTSKNGRRLSKSKYNRKKLCGDKTCCCEKRGGSARKPPGPMLTPIESLFLYRATI